MKGSVRVKKAKQALLAMIRHPWEHGTAMNAFLESGDEDIVVLMAHEAVARQSQDGRLACVWPTHNITDPCVCGEAVMFAYEKTGDAMYREAARRMLEYIRHAPADEDGIQLHNYNEPMIAADCMYMVPPFYAVMGEYEEAVRQADLRFRLLWNEDKGVLNHQWDTQKKALWRDKRWGGASGWNTAALVKILHWLPETMGQERELLLSHLQKLVEGMLRYQLPGGLFTDCLDEPDTFVETNAAQMLAYSIYRGVLWGLLDDSLLPAADAMRAAANDQLDEMGLVRNAAAAPRFDSPGVSPEAQAFYILMETAAEDLAEQRSMM